MAISYEQSDKLVIRYQHVHEQCVKSRKNRGRGNGLVLVGRLNCFWNGSVVIDVLEVSLIKIATVYHLCAVFNLDISPSILSFASRDLVFGIFRQVYTLRLSIARTIRNFGGI